MQNTYKYCLILLLSCFTTLAMAQSPAGDWYRMDNPQTLFKLHIEQLPGGSLAGSYDIEYPQAQTLNVPLDSLMMQGDSLLVWYTQGLPCNLRLKKVGEEYKGFLFVRGKRVSEYRFSQKKPKPIVRPTADPEPTFNRQDSLRGTITPERAWWDLTHYDLHIALDIDNRFIRGNNTLRYKVLKSHQRMQVDLQSPLKITKASQQGVDLPVTQEGNAYFIDLKTVQQEGAVHELTVFYEGEPREAVRAPWDGGFSWSKDDNGTPWVATSCQGEGASMWWPNKDHMYDEVDSMDIHINVPEALMAVANGRLVESKKQDNKTTTYHWTVKNPINNYGVNLNVGDYAHFSEEYKGEKGLLTCDYYVLKTHLKEAKEQFKQVIPMLKAFEHWFGPYPFYEDGYKLVHVPYLGMEHQSSVTYGNGFANGYRGRDLSDTGWGLKFDFIIIHESGHEWFANNITYKDIADMWVHESFTNYSESLFLDYHYGKEAGTAYVRGLRRIISNDKPMIGNYDVNDLHYSGDVYPKGANMLNTLRALIDDDEQWRNILRGLNEVFYHQTITTKEIEDYIDQQTEWPLSTVFDQYLRTTQIPTLEYYFKDGQLIYRWGNAVTGFDMPLKVSIDGKEHWLHPKTVWTNHHLPAVKEELSIDPDFYVAGFQIRP